MTDYIKREDAVKIIERLAKQLEPPINIRLADVRSGVLSAKWLVEDMQSTDVVEVVRCKDCKHYKRNIPCVDGHYNGCDEWIDEGNAITVYENDYCSYGERADT